MFCHQKNFFCWIWFVRVINQYAMTKSLSHKKKSWQLSTQRLSTQVLSAYSPIGNWLCMLMYRKCCEALLRICVSSHLLFGGLSKLRFLRDLLKWTAPPLPKKFTFILTSSIAWLIGSLLAISWNIYFLVIALNYFKLDIKEGDGDISFHRRSPN